MTIGSIPAPFGGRWTWQLAALAIALAAVILTTVYTAFGPISIPGILVLGPALLAAGVWLLFAKPQALVVLTPALMPLPLIGYFLPYELMLTVLAVVLLLHVLRAKDPWLYRLNRIEVVYLVFCVWALFTGFWCSDMIRYPLGVRRLGFAFISMWVAYRVVRFVPRPWFELGLVAAAGTLTFATLAKRFSTGFSGQQALISRGTATDLGWGWANYIAALLLLLTPILLYLALYGKVRWLRLASWLVIPMLTVVQMIIVARGALLLFAGGILAQVTGSSRRWRLLALAAAAAVLTVLIVGPWGEGIVMRFTSLRELSSGTIRIWYFREGWRRTLDNLPWGIGLNQGYLYPDKLQGLDPHNYWLDLSSELGVLGVIGWLAVLLVLWMRIRRFARHPAFQHEGLALQIVFWISQIHTMVEPTFQGNQYQFLFFWILGGYFGYHDVLLTRSASADPLPLAAAASSSR
jgi:hypothetical protein